MSSTKENVRTSNKTFNIVDEYSLVMKTQLKLEMKK